MPLVVEEDVAANPAEIGLLGTPTVMLEPERLADPVQQPGRGSRRLVHEEHGIR
jgi:hypothetical protein